MNYQPLRDFLLVTKDEAPKQTPGGLYVPGIVEDRVATGKVVAVGSGRVTSDGKVVPLELSVGDAVVFNKNQALELKHNENLFLLKEDQVFCVVK